MPLTRRFDRRPSVAILLAVAGVVLVDEPPPVAANAAAFGNVVVVAELEDGPFNVVTPILTARDFPRIFGGLGYDYGGVKYKYACARQSGGTEPFNGNGYVQTARLPFGKLSLCRVDTSVGSVSISPRAYVQGTKTAPFLLDDAQTFIWERDSVTRTATFNATAAVKDGSGGVFTGLVGGEQITITLNGAATTVTFQAGDNTQGLIITRINTAFGFTFASNNAGQLRLTSNVKGTGSQVVVTTSATATTLGLNSTPVNGTGDAVNIAQLTAAEFTTKVNAVDSGSAGTVAPDGTLRIVSKTGGTGTIRVLAGTGNAGLGFTNGTGGAITTAALRADVTINAGTRCGPDATDPTLLVVMQSTPVAKGSTATTVLKVRPAVDTGTYAGASAASVTTLFDFPGDQEWSVTNTAVTIAAMTAAQLDSAYLTAIAATLGTSQDNTRKLNGIVSARQSNAIRAAVLSNAVGASAAGHYNRRGFLSPPNGTTAQGAIAAAAPGVGAYRSQKGTYHPGGIRCVLQELIDGAYVTAAAPEIVRHADTFAASRFSVLGAGQNPAQHPVNEDYRFDQTTFPGLELAAATWDLNTYAAFKAAGVMAAQFDSTTGVIFGDGVTTVDPAVDPARVNVSRDSLAGLIGDTCADFAGIQVKRQATPERIDDTRTSIEGFLDTLKPPRGEVISDYLIGTNAGDTPGITEFTIAASQVSSMDTILFNLKVGPNAVALTRL